MKKIDIVQGSSQWLTWRTSGIGASDFPCIIKKNPYCKVEDIYRAKTDPAYKIPMNTLMERGIDNEALARDLFESQMGIEFPPLCCSHENEKYLASLDGYNEKYNEILEIKTPSPHNYEKYRANPPEYHLYQVQWQLFVTGAQTGYLFYYSPEKQEGFIKLITYDKKLIEDNLEKVDYFLACVSSGKKPEKLMSYPLVIEDKTLEAKCERYFTLKSMYDKLSKDLLELKNEIVISSYEDNIKVGNFQIRKQVVYRIDYKKACEDNQISLTDYKKEPTESWVIQKK